MVFVSNNHSVFLELDGWEDVGVRGLKNREAVGEV
jgi:hypothetical protein